MKRLIVHVLGQGVLGMHIAWHAAQQNADVTIIDRNDPFDLRPEKQTSSAAIGIIEPFSLGAKSTEYYLKTRMRYEEMIAAGREFVDYIDIRYFSKVNGYLDGPTGRAESEAHRWLNPKDEGFASFSYGEYFRGILVNTTLYNWWMREQLLNVGVKFVKDEIVGTPTEVMVEGRRAMLTVDCRGFDMKHTHAGAKLEATAGQTFLLHAPEGVEFSGVIGHPGSEMSFNLVPWMKVTEENLAKIALDTPVDPKKGGTLVLVGASKRWRDENWEPQYWELPAFLAGVAELDPRVNDWEVVLARKGMRARMPNGLTESIERDSAGVYVGLPGWAGAAYCGSWAYCQEQVSKIFSDEDNRVVWERLARSVR